MSAQDRTWAREILARARLTQAELAHAWGVSEGNVSKWLDGKLSADLALSRAVAFCSLTGVTMEELIAAVGLDQPDGSHVELNPVSDPPLGTVRVTPGKAWGRWHLLCHLDVSTAGMRCLTEAFDKISVDAIRRNP